MEGCGCACALGIISPVIRRHVDLVEEAGVDRQEALKLLTEGVADDAHSAQVGEVDRLVLGRRAPARKLERIAGCCGLSRSSLGDKIDGFLQTTLFFIFV